METLVFKKDSLISIKNAKKIVLVLVIIFVFDFFLFPAPVFASDISSGDNYNFSFPESDPAFNTLPLNNEIPVKSANIYEITAYSSDISQCDSAPCITANGFNVCKHGIEDTIAANFLPFGSKIKIPEIFGDKVFIVRDRMNSRYDKRVDIWMADQQKAIKFGYKYAKVEILEP